MDLHQSSPSTSEVFTQPRAENTRAHALERVAVVKSCDARDFYTINRLLCVCVCACVRVCVCVCGGEKKALNAWKTMKLPLFQWSRENTREKCQQQIAAGFYCRRRHGLCFPRVSFLQHYASSFHPIKHKCRLESRTHGASQCGSFWETQT